jgi:hypothetical protein
MKLIVALTNNWADYGGMDVYTINLGYKYHDDVSYEVSTGRVCTDMSVASFTMFQP